MGRMENAARRDGQRAAQREHASREISMEHRVDIFKVIQDAGVWLMFQPLNKAYGLFLKMSGENGILINSRHPLSLQRFTAAHEYGHYKLGHAQSLDGAAEIETSRSTQLDEIAANAFAAEFLMPLELVNRSMRQLGLGLKPARLLPIDVYRLSLLLGTSYQATAFHLVSHKKLTSFQASSLSKVTPNEIKRRGAMRELADSWADCWFLDQSQSGCKIYPRLGDEICLRLPAAPSTGHLWHIEPEVGRGSDTLDVFHEGFIPAKKEVVGASGLQDLAIRVDQATGAHIGLRRGRPWEPAESDARFSVSVEVVGRPLTGRDRGPADSQLLSA